MNPNVEEIGLTARAVEDLRLKRIQQALAEEELNLIQQRNAGASDAEIAATERVVDALRTKLDLQRQSVNAVRTQEDSPLAGAKAALEQFGEDVEKRGLQVKSAVEGILGGLEDAGVQALRGSGDAAKRVVDLIINEFLRLNIIKPLLASIFGGGSGAGFFASLFSIGGARADGGPVSAGVPYLVGERGPELFVPRASGDIVPGGAAGGRIQLGSVSVHIDARADQAQVAQLVARGVREGNVQSLRQLKAMGVI